jgi:hypothetical protein
MMARDIGETLMDVAKDPELPSLLIQLEKIVRNSTDAALNCKPLPARRKRRWPWQR